MVPLAQYWTDPIAVRRSFLEIDWFVPALIGLTLGAAIFAAIVGQFMRPEMPNSG